MTQTDDNGHKQSILLLWDATAYHAKVLIVLKFMHLKHRLFHPLGDVCPFKWRQCYECERNRNEVDVSLNRGLDFLDQQNLY